AGQVGRLHLGRDRPDVAGAGGAADTGRASGPDPERRVRLLDGPDVYRDVIEGEVLPLVAHPVLGPHQLEDLDGLVQPGAALVERDPEQLVLAGDVAQAQ